MRALGVDLGARRIGLALSDPSGILASPAGIIVRGPDPATDHAALARRVSEAAVDVVVVGLPLSLSGATGPAARAVLAEVDALAAAVQKGSELVASDLIAPVARAVLAEVDALKALLDVPVQTQDERFSTVVATRSLRQAAGGRAVKASRRRTGSVDEAAAAVLLQAWLDARAG